MKKILLIEDDMIVRENVYELISLVGYDVEVAENGMVGVAKAKSFKPDLIICDVMMPELDGYGVLYVLSQNPETATIPFIFLTAKSEKDDFRKGMELGADDYLFKPFESTELINAIEGRLKKNELLKKHFSPSGEGLESFLQEAKKMVTLNDIKEKSDLYRYSSKEYVYKEGEWANFVYFIQRGRVKTYKYNNEGKEYITSVFNEGQFFGFQPILEDRPYDEIAEVLEDTQLIKITKEDFLTLIYENREVAQQFMKMISMSLSSKEEDLMLMAYSSVRKRVSKKLQELLQDKDEITLLRTDLAKLTGTTKESLTRTLTEFKNSDIIKTEGKKIILIDRQKLQKMDMIW
ncbi:response regulator [Ochrovirga pacifica]|uniref:response regulator n=1 Tax=Ochrovirga pacifica TaxID=1042376 RepID=UPI0002559D7A|nr:response regulator [Ochrovirga pacifica]